MKVSLLSVLILFCVMSFAAVSGAQEIQPAQHQHASGQTTPPKPAETMPEMPDMLGMQHDLAHQQPVTLIDEILHHATAGTSAQPNSADEPMIMRARGKWMLMFHG